MSEQQLQFRVGLFVLTAGFVAAGLAFRFGELRWLWEEHYTLAAHFAAAPGVQTGTPVRKNGVTIGKVRELYFDEQAGGVTAVLDIQTKHRLRKDSIPTLSRSLLGDSAIEFSPGISGEFLRPGMKIVGESPLDPMELVVKLEQRVTSTLTSFEATSREWQQVATNINNLVSTNRGNLEDVVERTAESLHQFTLTMRNANRILGNPENEENLRRALASLPKVVEDTQQTMQSVKGVIAHLDENLVNLRDVTEPLAKRSNSIVTKLDRSVGNLEQLLAELNQFAKMVNNADGSLSLFANDPQLYRNLNQSASALQTVLKSLDPVVKDMRVFTDKVARHPELIGISGAVRGSSGLK